MMKISFLLTLFSVAAFELAGQEIITTSGDQFANTHYQLSWTLGEPVSETCFNPEYILTQGFNQSNVTLDPMELRNVEKTEISVYPNPASDFLCVHLTEVNSGAASYVLRSINGQLLFHAPLVSEFTIIPLKDFQAALYILQIIQDNKTVKTINLIITH